MQKVRAKKNLGQHFLTNQTIAARIANGFTPSAPNVILEIGPGMGILTRHLLSRPGADVRVVEIDHESVCYLMAEMPELNGRIIEVGTVDEIKNTSNPYVHQFITGQRKISVEEE